MMIYDLDKIDQLGIFDGINEVIATTENEEGVPNAAPLGIIKCGEKLSIRLFAGSHTYENIMDTVQFVANIIHDPFIFVETALSDIPEDQFVRRHEVLTLKEAEAWAFFKCDSLHLDIALPSIEFVKGEFLKNEFRAVNRGTNLAIEAAVAATRYVALGSELYLDEILKLRRIVSRCGGPSDIKAMERLDTLLDL
ncbi:MAG: DUF447 domain-containing protein [Methanotrichaceae archaeon]